MGQRVYDQIRHDHHRRSGALNLTNSGAGALSGTGARTLTLKGSDVNDNTLAAFIGDNGGGTSITKSGAGKWILTGNNTNSGTVTISAGTLQVGTGGASGSVGSGGTVVLPGNNNYSGTTTINLGTLQIGIGGASGALNNGASIVDNDTFIYNSTSTLTLNPAITGSGNVIVRKGTLQTIGNNSYAGWTEINPRATLLRPRGRAGQFGRNQQRYAALGPSGQQYFHLQRRHRRFRLGYEGLQQRK